MTRAILAGAALLAAAALPARAATFCVNTTGAGGCSTTIQAAVTAAGAGDTVRVSPGVYFENVNVPGGKDGLKIAGGSRLTTIIDADAPNTGAGLAIFSNGVKVSGIGVRNGTSFGMIATADNVVFQSVRVVGLHDTTAQGINGFGAGIQILASDVRACSGDGIVVLGSGAIVRGNTVAQVGAAGIEVLGVNAVVQSNKVTASGTDSTLGPSRGVAVFGDQATVVSNVIENVGRPFDAHGLDVGGINPVVQANRLTWAGTATVTCSTCTGGRATTNVVQGSSSDGFVLGADAPGFVAQSNRVGDAAGRAFVVIGTGVAVRQNSATESGVGAACFDVSGANHSLVSNMAQRCGGAGFRVQGDTIALATNQSMFSNTNGFLVDGDNGVDPAHSAATLTGDRALGTNGQGFAIVNGAVGTTVTLGTGIGNRVDLCDAGSGTTASGNRFGAVPATTTVCDIQ